MSLCVDSSALLKLYFEEPDSGRAEEILSSDHDWITGRLTSVEVRRHLARELTGSELTAARRQFERDWSSAAVGGGALPIVTFDLRQAQAARYLRRGTGTQRVFPGHFAPRGPICCRWISSSDRPGDGAPSAGGLR